MLIWRAWSALEALSKTLRSFTSLVFCTESFLVTFCARAVVGMMLEASKNN